MNGLWIVMMFWMLSNVGGIAIFTISVASIFLLAVLLVAVIHKDNGCCHNNLMIIIPIIIIMVALVCGFVGFYISIDNTSAPVSWFRDLPVGEIDGMKNIMSKHDKPLTIYQFYEAKLSVHKENHRQEQLDAMKGD